MESESNLTADIVTKYNTSATICGKVYNTLKNMIILNTERNLLKLTNIGNDMILHELSLIYKKENNKNIAFPVSISLNDIISHFSYDYDNLDSEYNNINDNDIIKIELGVSLGGCISMLSETFTIIKNKQIEKTINFLNTLQKDIIELIKHEETVDEIRIFIESKCTNNDIFPIANCISYQQDNSFIKTSDSKYMILNYSPKYDLDDYLITSENINFEFEEDDIFTINLTVAPIIEENITYSIVQQPHIFNINDHYINFKLKNSKIFYNKVKDIHQHYAFNINNYTDLKDKMGFIECNKKGTLDNYPILRTKTKLPIVTKSFTIIVGKHNSKILLYKLGKT